MKSDLKKLMIIGLASITLMGLAGCELQGLNDYGIEIRMRDDKYETKYIIVTGSNEAGAPGFDEYWKTLFKNSFGEEWKLW